MTDEDAAKKSSSPTTVPNRQPRRPHFIREWADARGFKQADLANEVGADKSVVSRWFNGTTPGVEWQLKLAALFGCEPQSLFSHPEEEWFKRFLAKRTPNEIERIKTMLMAAFPDGRQS
ncbi:MAG: helix-turn-helix transcriptional regulator [Burkholderiales bacterium]|nr:helix-turn-helix transcriptional regulator [Burkholderiales bacterium]